MTIAEGKAAIRSYYEDFLNRGDMAAADAIFMPEVSFQHPLGGLNGLEAVKGYVAAFRTAFPDGRFTVKDVFGEDDRVAARWRMTGSQTGAFGGKPPTGKHVTVSGNTIFCLRSGKIGEVWVSFDPARLA